MQMITDKEKLVEALLHIPVKYLRVRDLMWIEKNCDKNRADYHLKLNEFQTIGNDILSQVEKLQGRNTDLIEDKSLFGQIFGPSHKRAKT
jgi:hypothetical protein